MLLSDAQTTQNWLLYKVYLCKVCVSPTHRTNTAYLFSGWNELNWATFDSMGFVRHNLLNWIDQHVLFVWFRRIERVKIDCGTNVDLFDESSLMNKLKICIIMYILASISRHSWINLVRRVMFDVWPNGRALSIWVDPNFNDDEEDDENFIKVSSLVAWDNTDTN